MSNNSNRNFILIGRTFIILCREDPGIELGDEAEKIILCASGTEDDISEKMQAFLKYVAGGTPSDSFTNELQNAGAVKN